MATPTVLQSGGVGGDGDKTDEGETGGGGGENSNTVNESGNSTTDVCVIYLFVSYFNVHCLL